MEEDYSYINWNDIHENNEYALKKASQYGHLKIVKKLIEKGANIHAETDKALEMAVKYSHKEIITYLIENGAHMNENIYIQAIERGHLDIVKYLHKYYIYTPYYKLPYSATYGHLDIIKCLFEYQPPQEFIAFMGEDVALNKALKCAESYRHQEVIKYLVIKGANISNIINKELRIDMEYYKKYKPIMDECIQQIYYHPLLNRTIVENIEYYLFYKKGFLE